jgi:O-acetylserine/cysteine efflux transporter
VRQAPKRMSVPPGQGSKALGYAAGLLATLLWASSYIGAKLVMAELTPLAVLAARLVLGAAAYLVLLVALSRGVPAIPRRAMARLVLVALLGPALNGLGVVFAVSLLGAGTTSLVIMLVPVLTGLLAALAGTERFGAAKLLGVALALGGLGIVVLTGGPERPMVGASGLGLLSLLLAALGFAIYNVHSRPLAAHYPPLAVSAYLGLLAPLSLVPFALAGPLAADLRALGGLSAGGWALLVYISVGGITGGFFCWYLALRALGAIRASLLSYLIPLWGLAGSAWLLGEPITPWLPLGVALVVAGIAVSNRSPGDPTSMTKGPLPAQSRSHGD